MLSKIIFIWKIVRKNYRQKKLKNSRGCISGVILGKAWKQEGERAILWIAWMRCWRGNKMKQNRPQTGEHWNSREQKRCRKSGVYKELRLVNESHGGKIHWNEEEWNDGPSRLQIVSSIRQKCYLDCVKINRSIKKEIACIK